MEEFCIKVPLDSNSTVVNYVIVKLGPWNKIHIMLDALQEILVLQSLDICCNILPEHLAIVSAFYISM